MIECRLLCHSRSSHLSQALTGFALLRRSGLTRVTQRCGRPDWIADPRPAEAHLRVLLDRSIRVHYDMHDSGRILEEAADSADFYFKRSYDPTAIPPRLADKVFPFGFNYRLYPDGFDALELRRMVRLRGNWRVELLQLAQFAGLHHAPTVGKMHEPPRYGQEPHVLFMTRTWDPAECALPNLKEERERLNESRARCVALLRREFGRHFTGGLEPTAYALKHFKEHIIEDRGRTRQDQYLETLRRAPICVATTGLHGSNSWKTGEYIAFSKAVLSEPLRYAVPGEYRAGLQYLEFETPERCVEHAVRVFKDRHLREELMRRNYEYYCRYLRPDKLVLRTLAIAMGAQA